MKINKQDFSEEQLEDFYNELHKKLTKRYHEIIIVEFPTLFIKYPEEIDMEKIKQYMKEVNELYVLLISLGRYWDLCLLEVYKKTYKERKRDYLENYLDADEIDFLESEKLKLSSLLDEKIIIYNRDGEKRKSKMKLLKTILTNDCYKNIEFSTNKKVSFINHKIKEITSQNETILSLKKTQQLNRAEIELSNQSNDSSKLWFKVGVLFANGKIEKLYSLTNSFSQVAIELGNKNYRPYISESWGNTNIGNKNIFSNKKRVEIIKKHCLDNNIELSESFKCRASK